MTKTLDTLLNELEPTDELILLNKHYQRLDTEDSIKKLELMRSAVSHEHSLTGMKSREIFTFQKLGKAISIYKSI